VASATETVGRSTSLPLADSPLGRTIATTATDVWNDSCSVPELEYAVSYGAVGATANPTIVMDVWKQEPAYWRDRVKALAAERHDATEVDLAWAIVEEMSLRAAPLLRPAFDASGGRQGRLSMQTDPTLFRSFDRMLAQGEHFAGLAPNIIVKFPATSVGVKVMEEATYRGVNVNATVSFSVAQALAAGEAVERGLKRREAEGLPVDDMGPVITVMLGRLEDWLRAQADLESIISHPSAFPWSGVAVFKRTVAEFQRRGLRARPLAAAIRHHLHWSELIGGDVIITMPSAWQRRFNASDVEVRPRMDEPVDPAMIDDLRRHFPDFVRAYEPDGLAPEEFDTFAPSRRTLRAFIASYHELLNQVTEALLPNPDAKPSA
jgi:transaldolase